MTIWRAGMLAVCITDRYENREGHETFWPRNRGVYRVAGVDGEYLDFEEDPDKFNPIFGWSASDFRPLVYDDDNAELIQRIRACRPAKQPVEA